MPMIMLIEGVVLPRFPAWRGVGMVELRSGSRHLPKRRGAFFSRSPRAMAAMKVLGKTITARRPKMWRFYVLGVIPNGRRADGNVIIALAPHEYTALFADGGV
jgi:hypothetical protein